MIFNKVGQLSRVWIPARMMSSGGGQKVGFIGIGAMGTHMSRNLIEKGEKLVLCDQNQAALAPLVEKGAEVAKSPAEVADKCDKIFTMLPLREDILKVYCGKDGILERAKKGFILMDSSTVDPDTAKELEDHCSKVGAIFMDTPVAGAVPAARDGKLTFMIGGDAENVKAIEPLILKMGQRVFHCGSVGQGQVAKLCNNMLLAISMIGVAETLNMGQRLGMDAKMLTDIINISSGRCWSSEIYNPVPGVMENVPAANDYKPGFSVKLIAKDLKLAATVAANSLSPIPMGSIAQQVYRVMSNNGFDGKDFSSVYRFLQDKK